MVIGDKNMTNQVDKKKINDGNAKVDILSVIFMFFFNIFKKVFKSALIVMLALIFIYVFYYITYYLLGLL